MGLCLEPDTDDERRIGGRDHDDVTRTHAASLAHVEARTDTLHIITVYCTDDDFNSQH